MKNLKNRIEVIEEDLQKKEIKRQQEQKVRKVVTEAKNIKIERLPYSYSALKQFIDPETMSVHYNKHYKGYVEKLNKALSKKDYGDLELEQIVKSISRFNKTVRDIFIKIQIKKLTTDFKQIAKLNRKLGNRLIHISKGYTWIMRLN